MARKKSTTSLQAHHNTTDRGFYGLVAKLIPPKSRLLNLGCGSEFNFEKVVHKISNPDITSLDVRGVAYKPDYIRKFVVGSVEDELAFPKKFDVITFFELIEHIDCTDELLKNCFRNLKDRGRLIFSFPNLSSFWCRFELLIGLQPHVLEISNESSSFGVGKIGMKNCQGVSIHHIRGITHKAMKEMVSYHGFTIKQIIGYEYRLPWLFQSFPSIAPVNIFICEKPGSKS